MTDDTNWPTETQQRALAYSPKPFAALSFLSSLFVLYYLLIRHPEKRMRMYHRLIMATFICILPLMFVVFWGTWAMPDGTPWVVGASGNSTTCSVQGFIFVIFYLAFPFYYASISVFAYVAVKNNFQEEKYKWIEKWIHLGAYMFPLGLAITAVVKDWIEPGVAFCTMDIEVDCDDYTHPDCLNQQQMYNIYLPVVGIVFIELMVGTLMILYLICRFDKIHKEADDAIGMTRILGAARKHRLREVMFQTGLYLISFWIGYIPTMIEHFIRIKKGKLNYDLIILAHCMFSCQGFFILLIYFALQSRSQKDDRVTDMIPSPPDLSARQTKHETVSKIRDNAAMPRRKSSSLRDSCLSGFSFNIFDGTPSDDSPWAAYLDGSSDDLLFETVIEEEDSTNSPSSDSPHLPYLPGASASTPLLSDVREDIP